MASKGPAEVLKPSLAPAKTESKAATALQAVFRDMFCMFFSFLTHKNPLVIAVFLSFLIHVIGFKSRCDFVPSAKATKATPSPQTKKIAQSASAARGSPTKVNADALGVMAKPSLAQTAAEAATTLQAVFRGI